MIRSRAAGRFLITAVDSCFSRWTITASGMTGRSQAWTRSLVRTIRAQLHLFHQANFKPPFAQPADFEFWSIEEETTGRADSVDYAWFGDPRGAGAEFTAALPQA